MATDRESSQHREIFENCPDKVKLAFYQWCDRHNLSLQQLRYIKNNTFGKSEIGNDVYWSFAYNNIFYGIEPDGHIHT